MKIAELIETYRPYMKNGDINLGYINGWGDDTYDLHRELKKYEQENTYFKSGPAYSQGFEFIANDGDQQIKVKWQLDSGD